MRYKKPPITYYFNFLLFFIKKRWETMAKNDNRSASIFYCVFFWHEQRKNTYSTICGKNKIFYNIWIVERKTNEKITKQNKTIITIIWNYLWRQLNNNILLHCNRWALYSRCVFNWTLMQAANSKHIRDRCTVNRARCIWLMTCIWNVCVYSPVFNIQYSVFPIANKHKGHI